MAAKLSQLSRATVVRDHFFKLVRFCRESYVLAVLLLPLQECEDPQFGGLVFRAFASGIFREMPRSRSRHFDVTTSQCPNVAPDNLSKRLPDAAAHPVLQLTTPWTSHHQINAVAAVACTMRKAKANSGTQTVTRGLFSNNPGSVADSDSTCIRKSSRLSIFQWPGWNLRSAL